jgi:hypothetical protein
MSVLARRELARVLGCLASEALGSFALAVGVLSREKMAGKFDAAGNDG